MGLNRTLNDFGVKGAQLTVKKNGIWVKPFNPVTAPNEYRLTVSFGNLNGRIDWGDEGDFDKVNIEIRVVALGFSLGVVPPVLKEQIEFYTDETYANKVAGQKKYRTKFLVPEHKTTDVDKAVHLHLKFKRDMRPYRISRLRWKFGVYGAVRNHHWKNRFTRQ